MSFILAGVAAVKVGHSIFKGVQANKRKKAAEAEAKTAKAEMDARKEQFANLDISNPFMDMDNVYEDLTVNQKEADFAKQQTQQSQANILNQMKGSAGSSGIAGLAQAMANQGALDAQKSAMSIGKQEANNQKLALGEEARIQDKQIGGEIQMRKDEKDKISTLYGMDAQDYATAQSKAALANQEKNAAYSSAIGGVTDYVTGGVTNGFGFGEKMGDINWQGRN
jgi:hypothetical protein